MICICNTPSTQHGFARCCLLSSYDGRGAPTAKRPSRPRWRDGRHQRAARGLRVPHAVRDRQRRRAWQHHGSSDHHLVGASAQLCNAMAWPCPCLLCARAECSPLCARLRRMCRRCSRARPGRRWWPRGASWASTARRSPPSAASSQRWTCVPPGRPELPPPNPRAAGQGLTRLRAVCGGLAVRGGGRSREEGLLERRDGRRGGGQRHRRARCVARERGRSPLAWR